MQFTKLNLRQIFFHSSWALTFTSGLSYVFGALRDRVFAQTFGLSRTLDVYHAAFVIPDMLLNILIGTTLSAAFIPIFSELYDRDKKAGFKYVHQILTGGVLIVLVFGVLIGIFLPFFTEQLVPGFSPAEVKEYVLITRILLFSPILFTFSRVYGRMLLSFQEFFWYGLAPAMYNLGIIGGALFLAPHNGSMGLVVGTMIGAFLHMFIRFVIIRRRKYAFTHQVNLQFSPEIKETLRLTAPKIFQYGMWNILLLSFTSIASELPIGSISVYNYARNFQSLPVSLLGIAIALAMYPVLAHAAGKHEFITFKKEFRRSCWKVFFYTTAGAIALALLSRTLVTLLLSGKNFGETEIDLLTKVLQIYCIAVPLESLMHVYHRAYYSIKNTIIPATWHALIIGLTIVLAHVLTPHIGIFAIPLSFASGLLLQIIVLGIVFPWVLRKKLLDVGC